MLIDKEIIINGKTYRHIISELWDGDKLVKSPYKYIQRYGDGSEFTEIVTLPTDKNKYIESDIAIPEEEEKEDGSNSQE